MYMIDIRMRDIKFKEDRQKRTKGLVEDVSGVGETQFTRMRPTITSTDSLTSIRFVGERGLIRYGGFGEGSGQARGAMGLMAIATVALT